ncbi:PREDICTED: cytochrome b5-like [Habropoda laboriosa]|uniref:cytochrome b5-like n=1 Tax=Habropoda laboriosa TaxID=597456 RepID=UPI00083E43C1|nr:PREDICTED: cytochrome b5-like [Habropoda laboriosa]
MSKTFSASQVSMHNKEKDLWIIYKDGVYDVTKFLKEHPGGEEVLIDLAGKDATKCFDDVGHTIEAIQLRETYKIGTVDNTASAEQSPSSGVQGATIDDDNWDYQPLENKSSPWLPVFVTAGVLIYSILFYYFWFS